MWFLVLCSQADFALRTAHQQRSFTIAGIPTFSLLLLSVLLSVDSFKEKIVHQAYCVEADHRAMSILRKPSHPKDWLKERNGFAKTCPALACSTYKQEALEDAFGEASSQASIDYSDEVLSRRPTETFQESWTSRFNSLRGSSENFQSQREVVDWISESCVHPQNVSEIFAIEAGNGTCADEAHTSTTWLANTTPACRKQVLSSLEFDVLSYSADELVDICLDIFVALDIDKDLRIERDALHAFICSVRHQMKDNPYHNWFHVVDVAQSLYSMGLECGLWDTMPSKEKLAVLVAAVCHDLDHPGVNNAFIDKTRSILHSRFNIHTTCLEKHHSWRATELMTNTDGAGLLDTLPADDRDDIVKRIEDIILATDMARHVDYIARLHQLVESRRQAPASAPAAAAFDPAERRFVAELLVKCADMANVLRPFSVAKKWAMRITEEFFRQGDLERSLELEVSPMCDRHRDSRVGLQRGFVGFVTPFYAAVARLLPSLHPLVARLESTRAGWQAYSGDEALLAECP